MRLRPRLTYRLLLFLFTQHFTELAEHRLLQRGEVRRRRRVGLRVRQILEREEFAGKVEALQRPHLLAGALGQPKVRVRVVET